MRYRAIAFSLLAVSLAGCSGSGGEKVRAKVRETGQRMQDDLHSLGSEITDDLRAADTRARSGLKQAGQGVQDAVRGTRGKAEPSQQDDSRKPAPPER
ncbi:MAG TPA: hypothetical protein VEV17_17535 [Bryobacteraceae bacterium]|nr:hypothetical protein [Bryobacteraceae bacterium]